MAQVIAFYYIIFERLRTHEELILKNLNYTKAN